MVSLDLPPDPTCLAVGQSGAVVLSPRPLRDGGGTYLVRLFSRLAVTIHIKYWAPGLPLLDTW